MKRLLGRIKTVRTKIVAAFVIVVVITTVMGVVGLGELGSMKGTHGTRVVFVTLLVLAFALTLGFALARMLSGPLRKMIAVLRAISEGAGDLTLRIPVETADEVGQTGAALNTTLERIEGIMRTVRGSSLSLASSSEELSATSSEMGASAEETSAQAHAVAAAAEQVSTNIQTVAAGAEEMSASIREIAHSASEAAGVAASAMTIAETTNATVTKLGESSAEVGEVIKVITSIAEQTNLLALNATIEAARAGEAGKGFAVVANEVKELAKQTAEATEDIGRRVAAIQTDSKAAVDAIAQITEVMGKINETQTTIASAVEEQTVTTNEITRNVSEAATGASEIASNVTHVAEAAQETSHGAQSTRTASGDLARLAEDLTRLVGQFTIGDGSARTSVSLSVSRRPGAASMGIATDGSAVAVEATGITVEQPLGTGSARNALRAALTAHRRWKSRISEAIRTGVFDVTPEQVRADDRCDFGKWLYGEADRHSSAWAKARDLHARFHIVTSEVLELALAGRSSEASHQLLPEGPFGIASTKLIQHITAWHAEERTTVGAGV